MEESRGICGWARDRQSCPPCPPYEGGEVTESIMIAKDSDGLLRRRAQVVPADAAGCRIYGYATLFALLACLLKCPGFDSTAAAAADVRPNVIVIVADDLGWADLGCYGCRFHQTPALDRLAR